MRIGFASQDVPFNIPHCIARHITQRKDDTPRLSVRDKVVQILGGL